MRTQYAQIAQGGETAIAYGFDVVYRKVFR